MLVPNYEAYIKRFIYQEPVSWVDTVPFIYSREDLIAEAAADFAVLGEHEAIPLVIEQAWFPLMPVAAGVAAALAGEENNGRHGMPYTAWEPATPADMVYSDGIWTIQRVLEQQIPIWETSRLFHKAFMDAVIAREIDDTFLTERNYLFESDFEADTTIAEYTKDTVIASGARFIDPPVEFEQDGMVASNLKATVTPCTQIYSVEAYSHLWALTRTNHCILAVEDPDPPMVVAMPIEDVADYTEYSNDDIPVEDRILINGFYDVSIQPVRRNNRLSSDARRAELITARNNSEAFWANFAATNGYNSFRAEYEEPSVPAPTTRVDWTTEIGGADASGVYNLEQLNLRYPSWSSYLSATKDTTATTDSVIGRFYAKASPGGPDELLATFNQSYLRRKKALSKPWDHTDPDLEGLVPFRGSLWRVPQRLAEFVEYSNAPDGRYDGLYFPYAVSKAAVLRAWFGHVRWVKDEGSALLVEPFLPAVLNSTGLLNTETGEITDRGACFHMTPVEFDLSQYLTPGFLGVDWPDYPWGDYTFTLPAGQFFLQDGSAAPLYPDFTGAYVYDTHLQKWGKFDENYKRLVDYQSINTYIPGTQSSERFGIHGGIMDADGKLKLFSEVGDNSEIVYGKFGYYRQGMTTMEEIRVHHRIPVSGTIEVTTSVEGKNLAIASQVSTDIVDSNFWQHNGSYSGKWHRVKIKGQYDISYLEYRGIISGKR